MACSTLIRMFYVLTSYLHKADTGAAKKYVKMKVTREYKLRTPSRFDSL